CGKKWKTALLSGRLEAMRNPTHLRLARVKQAKSQSAVAEEVGLTYATYGAIENGNRAVPAERAKEIANCLGITVKRGFEAVKTGSLKMQGKMIARKDTDE